MMVVDLFEGARGVLAVVAHPDDESFGLGAVLDHLTSAGVGVAVLCFTHGEASTLRGRPGDLAVVRAAELAEAARALGVAHTRLLDYPDGRLARSPLSELAGHVDRFAAQVGADHLLAFDTTGVTGHPDHRHATRAALAAAARRGWPVTGWAIPQTVAAALNAELGTAFAGRHATEVDRVLPVTRHRQWRAIRAHASQSHDNPALLRRLQLLGAREHLCILRHASGTSLGATAARPYAATDVAST